MERFDIPYPLKRRNTREGMVPRTSSSAIIEHMVSEAVHNSMVANKRVNTKPELAVRHMLREIGWRGYRCDWKKCTGHPDIAFPGRKIAIFVHGCFCSG